MISLYEIDPGVWIVPELVTAVTVRLTGYMITDGYHVRVTMVGSAEPLVVRSESDGYGADGRPRRQITRSLAEWHTAGLAAAREVTAWIDERRIEPLRVVSNA